jgi:Ser/Thr protein kinase RdoA (MazF antagonist)
VTIPARILELVGLPGAGKTTAGPAVIEHLRERGFEPVTVHEAIEAAVGRSTRGRLLRVVGVRPPFRRRARVLLIDAPTALALPFVAPRLAAELVAALWRLPVGWGHRAAIAGRTLRVVAAHRFVATRVRAGEVVVVDEGPVHRVVNLYAWRRTTPTGPIRRYLDAIPLPDAVLEVRVPSAEAARRLTARAAGPPQRLRGADEARVRRFVDGADAALGVARAHLESRIAWTMLSGAESSGAGIAQRLDELGFVGSGAADSDCRSTPVYRPLLGVTVRRPGRGGADRRRPMDGAAIPPVVRDAWRLEPSRVEAIGAGGRSDSFLVDRISGGRVVVKRYKAGLDPAAVESEHLVLRALEARAFPAPRLVPAADGALVVCDEDGRRWAAFEVIRGSPLHARIGLPGERSRSAFQAGRALGALHAALADVETPHQPDTGFRSMTGPRVRGIDWYLDRLAADGSPTEAASVASALPWARDRLGALDAELAGGDAPRGLIHGDYGPYNLLVRRGEPIVVIDFELARLDWLLTDLATAVPRFAAGRLGFADGAARSFVEGYRSCHRLADDALRSLPDVASFLALRRVAVAWDRYVESGDGAWLSEAAQKLGLARAIADGRHGLGRLAESAR